MVIKCLIASQTAHNFGAYMYIHMYVFQVQNNNTENIAHMYSF